MATFFTTVVKAPVTGIIMTVELTGEFIFLLPVILGVAIGYLLGDVFRTQPIYDALLEEIVEEQRASSVRRKVSVVLRVEKDAPADGRAIRDILWPSQAVVTDVTRAGKQILVEGRTTLRAGDIVAVTGNTAEEDVFLKMLTSAAGTLLQSRAEEADDAPPAKEG